MKKILSCVNVNFAAGNYIGSIAKGTAINVTLKNDHLLFVSRLNKKNALTLNYESIISVEYSATLTEREKTKKALSRAIVGGVFFGALGTVIGGLSGMNDATYKKRGYIVIKFKRNNNSTGVAYLKIVGASLNWNEFLSELKSRANIIENETH